MLQLCLKNKNMSSISKFKLQKQRVINEKTSINPVLEMIKGVLVLLHFIKKVVFAPMRRGQNFIFYYLSDTHFRYTTRGHYIYKLKNGGSGIRHGKGVAATKKIFDSAVRKATAAIEISTFLIIMLGIGVIVKSNDGVDAKSMIGEIAGWVNLVAYFPYFVAIIKGETKPSRTTWWIWTALEIMMSTGYIMSGAESTKWLPIASLIGMFMTAMLSVWFGKKGWTLADIGCFFGVVSGVFVWEVSGSAFVALCVFLFIDILATIPTIAKSWEDPDEEDVFAWTITLLSGVVNLFAIDSWNFSIALLPLHNLSIYAVVVAVLIISKKKKAVFNKKYVMSAYELSKS